MIPKIPAPRFEVDRQRAADAIRNDDSGRLERAQEVLFWRRFWVVIGTIALATVLAIRAL